MLFINRRFLKTTLFSFFSGSETKTPPCFLLLFLGMCTCTGVIFENHSPERCKVHNLWIFIIQGYALHFTFRCSFSCGVAKDGKCIVFRATRDKLFDVGACAILFHLICEVTHSLLSLLFWVHLHSECKSPNLCHNTTQTRPNLSGTRKVWAELV